MKAAKPLLSGASPAAGGIQAPQPGERLFFAVYPDADTAADISRLAQALCCEHALRGKPARSERLHVTLHFLGDYAGLPQALIISAKQSVDRVEASAFEVKFDRVSSFPGRTRKHPLVLRGGAGLQCLFAFQRQIGERLAAAGLGRFLDQPFIPHLTLLYDEQVLTSRPTEPVTWMVREFLLVHSVPARGEQQVLGRWPLRTAA
ncbi:MAG TPA: 2'-5' RNA ligase family protein [Acidimicrobiales bacterium]|nr:2'-5' RNA ligase family protein [Acidimicrobiales bacterium]